MNTYNNTSDNTIEESMVVKVNRATFNKLIRSGKARGLSLIDYCGNMAKVSVSGTDNTITIKI